MDRYLDLKLSDPGSAERFLSNLFKVDAKFDIALADDSGRGLSNTEMVSALVEDVQARARNDFPQDQEASEMHRLLVAAIRQAAQVTLTSSGGA